jgi:NADP-dependent 3-hydroxy acid dehydrogenase YdfG
VGSLTNQMAIVSGASSGIGRAIALGLAREGTSLCLLGRDKERLLGTARTATNSSPKVTLYQVDLSSEQDLSCLIQRLEQELDYVDVVVHAAGDIVLGDMNSSTIDDLDRQYKINLRAPYLLTQKLLPRVRARRGQVVFINSSMGVHARANVGQYAATKQALKAVADSLRDEVNPDGVRVLSIFAGRTASAMQETIHRLENKAYDAQLLLQPEDIASVVIHALTLPRTAEVTDIHIRPLVKLG